MTTSARRIASGGHFTAEQKTLKKHGRFSSRCMAPDRLQEGQFPCENRRKMLLQVELRQEKTS
jgi:hypothetical protein